MRTQPDQHLPTQAIQLFVSRARCGCPVKTIQLLDGQHPYTCLADRLGEGGAPSNVMTIGGVPLSWTEIHPVVVRPQPPHQVDGVPMPWGWMPHPADELLGVAAATRPIPDLDYRWCDLSEDGEGGWVARRWPELRVAGVALHLDGDWSWRLFDTHSGSDLAAGKSGNLLAALDEVQAGVDQIVAHLAEAVSEQLADAN
jgi:hypothetical protein